MLLDPESKPYAAATLSLVKLGYAEIWPTQRYVLSPNLYRAQWLEWELSRFGHDSLGLEGYLTLWTDQSDEPTDLLPPILEKTVESDGSVHNLINDGAHRLYAGRLAHKLPTVVLAENLPPNSPYYAYPLPGPDPWNAISILPGPAIPPDFIKKWHRTPDNKKLYRDFNSAFQNVGGPRGGGAAA